jgi:hypothetical protein
MEAIDEAFSSAFPDHRPTPPTAGPGRYRVGAALILIGASLVAPVIILAGRPGLEGSPEVLPHPDAVRETSRFVTLAVATVVLAKPLRESGLMKRIRKKGRLVSCA